VPDLRKSILTAIKEETQESIFLAAKEHRMAWAEGHDTLYKYMSLGSENYGYVVDVLESSRVYFSSPDQLNDPADCKPVFKLAKDLSDPEFVRELEDDEARMIEADKLPPEEIASLRQKYGVEPSRLAAGVTEHTRRELEKVTRVFCMTVQPANTLMWAHYAEKHTGVCLHFRCRSQSLFGLARRVVYSTERKAILIPISYTPEEEIPDLLAFGKSADWKYEEEYRIVSHEDAYEDYPLEGRYCRFKPEQLIGITFGLRISASHRKRLTEIVSRRRTPMGLFQMVEEGEHFTVKPIAGKA
jgi:hypothetical protein